MRLFGLEITRAAPQPIPVGGRGWYPVYESYAGAWQQNVTVDRVAVLANHAVFACITLIARDIAKLRLKLVAKDSKGIWTETENPAYSPVLRKPNHFQTRIQFWESWLLSKLSRGNTYALKVRDNRNVVTKLYVLDPTRVEPMVTEDGGVWYRLRTDHLSGLQATSVMVPASEIVHDRFNCLFHPLVGLPPVYASGLAATAGLRIEENSTTFFGAASRPGGLLIAPGRIDPAQAATLKDTWTTNFSGQNAGKVAILGDGMKYEALGVSAEDSQLIEQLKYTAEVVCSTFHVPPYKIGLGTMPTYNNVQALNVEYYSQCLQSLIEDIELCLDEGLATGEKLGTEFDIDGLLRMDAATQMDVLEKAAGILEVDEMRARLGLGPTAGGAAVYLQQQNFSLEALAKRDAQADPFASSAPAEPPANDDEPSAEEQAAERALHKAALRQMVRDLVNA